LVFASGIGANRTCASQRFGRMGIFAQQQLQPVPRNSYEATQCPRFHPTTGIAGSRRCPSRGMELAEARIRGFGARIDDPDIAQGKLAPPLP